MKMRMISKKNLKGIATEYLPWMLIALLVLVIVFFAIAKYSADGIGFIDKIKSLFRRS